MPPDLKQAVIDGLLTMVDCKFAGYFIGDCHLFDMVEAAGEPVEGMSSHFYSDNSPSVGIVNQQSSQAKSPMPARTLRWLAWR